MNYNVRPVKLSKSGKTAAALLEDDVWFDCHCGNAIFVNNESESKINVINFYNKTARQETSMGFILDLGNNGGWFCLHCGTRHKDSEKITEIFQKWIRNKNWDNHGKRRGGVH